MMRKTLKIKIYDVKKMIISLLILSLLVIVPLIFFANNIQADVTDDAYTIYQVKKGDTVWSIAEDIRPSHIDVREIVYEIKEMNKIGKNEDIFPMQELLIPIY